MYLANKIIFLSRKNRDFCEFLELAEFAFSNYDQGGAFLG